MPINMLTEQKYEIDYVKLHEEMMELPIFSNKGIQSMYIDNWVNSLRQADENSVESYFDPNNRVLAAKEKKEAPETFQTVVNLKTAEAYIHFRVSRIIQILEMNGVDASQAISIDIDEFKEKKRINWTETKDEGTKNEPIIIVPFTIGKTFKELVIDGNHRITKAIRDNQKDIKAFFVAPEALVDNHLLSVSGKDLASIEKPSTYGKLHRGLYA